MSIVPRLPSSPSSILSLGESWLDSEVEGFPPVDSYPRSRPGNVGDAFSLVAQGRDDVVRIRLPLAMIMNGPPGQQEGSEEQAETTDFNHGVIWR